MSWKCSCGMMNQGRHQICVNNWFYTNCRQISANTPDYFMARDVAEELSGYELTRKEVNKSMTPNEELFATYYNRGKILVKDMDDTSLREHREQLRQIATEAKAQLLASDDEIRERGARKSLKEKEWIASVDSETSVSDAINVVEKRRARMTKMDKLRQQLIDVGMDDATIREMVGNLERKATEKNLKTVTFKKKTEEDSAIQVKAKPDDNGEPFNPAKLTFGS